MTKKIGQLRYTGCTTSSVCTLFRITLGQNKSGVTVFSFGNTRIDYEDNTVSSAIFMTNFAKPRAKLLTKSYNPKTKRTEIVVQEKEKVEKIRHQAKTIVQQKVEIFETNQHLEQKKVELENKEEGEC